MFHPRRALVLALTTGIIILILLWISQFQLPEPTGHYTVGRTVRNWVDLSRPEILTEDTRDFREVPVTIWYPSEPGTGASTAYFPNLADVAAPLVASGEVERMSVFGLRFIRSHERFDAQLSRASIAYPIVLLSPGNATNVEFYTSIANELASNGYIVVGLNHPYDVAAVVLQDRDVAQFVKGPIALKENQEWVTIRIVERTADVLFVLDQLYALNQSNDPLFAERLDLTKVGVMGHSLGGITAMQACLHDLRLQACLNFDGLGRGGPFSASDDLTAPEQPFMLMTKEEQLHPTVMSIFESARTEGYLVKIKGADHDSFTDSPLLLSALLPVSKQAERILTSTRTYTLAFFDRTLRQNSASLLDQTFQSPQVEVYRYPSP